MCVWINRELELFFGLLKECEVSISMAAINDFLKPAGYLLGVDVAPFNDKCVEIWGPLDLELYSIEWLEAHAMISQLLYHDGKKQTKIKDFLHLYLKGEMECDPHDKECAKRVYSLASKIKGERVDEPGKVAA